MAVALEVLGIRIDVDVPTGLGAEVDEHIVAACGSGWDIKTA